MYPAKHSFSAIFILFFMLIIQSADAQRVHVESDVLRTDNASADTLWFGDYYLIIRDDVLSLERKRPDVAEAPEPDPETEEEQRERRQTAFEQIDNVETEWLENLDLGMALFMHDQEFTMPDEYRSFELDQAWSRHLRFYIFQMRINLIHQKLNLVPGLALDYKRYSLSRPVTLISGGDSLVVEEDSDVEYDRNRFINTDLMLPLYLYYRSNPLDKSESFNLMLGGHVGFLWRDHMRQRTENRRVRDSGDYNVNRFSYGLGMRVGYGRFNFYVNYNLTPTFQENRGPELHAFTAGITLLGLR